MTYGSDKSAQESAHARRTLEDVEQHLQAEDFTAAQDACRELLAEHPEYVGALTSLGRAYMAEGKYDFALPCFFRASMLGPETPEILVDLGEVYCALNADDAALDAARDALEMDPGDLTAAGAHLVQGRIYERASNFVRATDHLEKAIALNPDLVSAARLLGVCHMKQGNRDDAAGAYQTALDSGVSPLDHSQILYDLAQGAKSGEAKKLLTQIDALGKATSGLETPLHDAFFLGRRELGRARILEGLGKHADAWHALEAGNAPLRDGYADANQALQAQSEPTIGRARGWNYAGPTGAAGGKEVPVTLLVLGASCSGKSTLEQLIGSVAGVELGYDSELVQDCVAHVSSAAGLLSLALPGQLPDALFDEFSKYYASAVTQRARGAKLFTMTHQGLIHDLGRVAELVPDVRVVFIERNAGDAAHRIFGKMYPQDTNPFAYDMASIRDHLKSNAQLIEAWSNHLGDISIRISYEDMVADPKSVLAKVANLCGLPVPQGNPPEIGDDRGCAEPYREFSGNIKQAAKWGS